MGCGYAAGKPVKDIIKQLNKRDAKRLRSDRPYERSTVYYILNNEMYVGGRRLQKEPHTDHRTKRPVPDGEYKSYYIENDHEAIISREVWDAAQERLKKEEERKAKGRLKDSKSCRNDVISEEKLFEALSDALGIKWKGIEAVTEKAFAMIEKATLFDDRKIEIEMENEE